MDLHPTPFPGKVQSLRSKSNRKIAEPPKINAKEHPIQRQRRAFGTVRNPNIPMKIALEKSTAKPRNWTLGEQSKPSVTVPLPSSTDVTQIPESDKSPEENRAKPKKKSVCFSESIGEILGKSSPEGDAVSVRTPARTSSSSKGKPRYSGTPYLSARRCSDCRLDKLETASYWLGQIRMAESVGKHFVSLAFFRLAFESKAEPFGNLRVELKKYLVRHNYLSNEPQWRAVSFSYGLLKNETEIALDTVNSGFENGSDGGVQESKDEAAEESKTNSN